MKGKNLKQLLNDQKVKRVGCILLAAAVLGTGAWAVDKGQGSDVPELTSFVDLDDQTSINEDEVPLASAPKTSVKTKTSTTKKIVNLKKKAKKTYTKKSAPKSVKSPTITRTSAAATITTKKVTTTYVTKKYKKNSKKMTMITTKKIKTTVTTVAKKSSGTAGTTATQTAAATASTSNKTTSSGKNTAPYKVSAATLAPLLDSRALKAYQELHFDITIDGSVSYAGYFDARQQSITLREESDTVYHELGHFVAFIAGNVDTKASFQAIYQQEKNSFTGSRRIYAIQNASEYFAECFREYTLNPATLKSTCPQTFEAITNALNKITDSQIAQAKAFYGSIWTK